MRVVEHILILYLVDTHTSALSLVSGDVAWIEWTVDT